MRSPTSLGSRSGFTPFLAAFALTLTGCYSSGTYTVDGVRLRHSRWIEIEPSESDPAARRSLSVDLARGDIEVKSAANGAAHARASIREATPFDAQLVWEAGSFQLTTQSGKPALIVELLVELDGGLDQLTLETGLGDLSVNGVSILDRLVLESSLGDLEARGLGAVQRVELSTNLGDINASDFECGSLVMRSSLGDLDANHVSSLDAQVETALGDVEFSSCAFNRMQVKTSLGDIEGGREAQEAGLALDPNQWKATRQERHEDV